MKFLILFLFSIQALAQVDVSHLSTEVSLRIERVPEFKFIKEEADKLGVKVYLFGGTASAFAHYVRWDLEREAGDEKYQAERFDYDFTNIYRGNQDLDIVVDGTSIQAAQLQQILQREYPHFIGSKEAWEVRLLDAQVGDKLPLLDNPDFLNQHTDTNSTGMVAVNAESGEIIFRDLFDWENPDSRFLNDVAAGRIKFLFSDNHETTSRFKEGKNPPVFAAIRYLAKLAQYEVDEAEGDLEIIKRIVEETNWREVGNNSYVRHKLEEFGKKVLLNAPDSEYAWNLLEETGLREKLIEVDGSNFNSVESLSWWMNKEPLRSKKIGLGNGRTAKQIFGDKLLVAHETISFSAYENITRSSKGRANAFISRRGAAGEAAALGDGFYVRQGREGARGTDLTIRFSLNPEARDGADFTYSGDFIVVTNKNALRLVQENLSLSMTDFIRLILKGEVQDSDRGLIEKFKRKFSRVSNSSDGLREAIIYAEGFFLIAKGFPKEKLLGDISFSDIESFDELFDTVLSINSNFRKKLLNLIKNEDFWLNNPNWVKSLILNGMVDKVIAKNILSKKGWEKHPEILKMLFDQGNADREIVKYVLSEEHWIGQQYEIIEILLGRGNADDLIAKHIIANNSWKNSKRWFDILLKRGSAFEEIINYVLPAKNWESAPGIIAKIIKRSAATKIHLAIVELLRKPKWKKYPELILSLIEAGKVNLKIVDLLSEAEYWAAYPKIIESLLEKNDSNIDSDIIVKVLSQEQWALYPDLVMTLIKQERSIPKIVKEVLSKKYWFRFPELIQYVLETGDYDEDLVQSVLSQDDLDINPEWIELILERGVENYHLVQFVLSKEKWSDHPEWIELMLEKNDPVLDAYLAKYVLTEKHWSGYPEWVELILERQSADEDIANALSKEHWPASPKWVSVLIKSGDIRYPALFNLLNSKSYSNHPELVLELISHIVEFDESWLDEIASELLTHEQWVKHPEFITELIKHGDSHSDLALVEEVLINPLWSPYPELVIALIEKGNVDDSIVNLLGLKHWAAYPNLLEALIKKGEVDRDIVYTLDLTDKPKAVMQLIENGYNDEDIVLDVLSDESWSKYPEVIRALVKKNTVMNSELIGNVLWIKEWVKYPDIIMTIIKLGDDEVHIELAESLLNHKHWAVHPELLIELIKMGGAHNEIIDNLLVLPHWYNQKEVVSAFIKFSRYSYLDERLVERVFSTERGSKYIDLILEMVKKGKADESIIKTVLPKMNSIRSRGRLLNALIKKDALSEALIDSIYGNSYWNDHPNIVISLINKKFDNKKIFEGMFYNGYLDNSPEVLAELIRVGEIDDVLIEAIETSEIEIDLPEFKLFLGTNNVTFDSLKRELNKRSFTRWIGIQRRQSIPPVSCTRILENVVIE